MAITNQTRRRRIRLLKRRLEHLDERIEQRGQFEGDSYDIAEAYALEWAIEVLQTAIEQELVYDLEAGLRDEA